MKFFKKEEFHGGNDRILHTDFLCGTEQLQQ